MSRHNTCNYSTEWQPYINDYDKNEYDVMTKAGKIFRNCYPNAGIFMSFEGGNNGNVDGADVDKIRITPRSEQKLNINSASLYATT